MNVFEVVILVWIVWVIAGVASKTPKQNERDREEMGRRTGGWL